MATGMQLAVQRWGVGNARRALLVHGVASAGATWWQIAHALEQRGYDVVAPDLRGHGSSPLGGSYRIADFAADLALLGDRWDLVIGHSLGGPVVAELVGNGVEAPRVVLIDPVFVIDDAAFEDIVVDQMLESDPVADPRTYAEAHPTWHALDAHTKAIAARAVAADTIERSMRDNAPWQWLHLVDALKPDVDVAVLGADPDVFSLCPPAIGEQLSAQANVTYRMVAGAGHGIQRDNPAAVIEACA